MRADHIHLDNHTGIFGVQWHNRLKNTVHLSCLSWYNHCSVRFELTLNVRRIGITSPIISIANTKTGFVLRTDSGSPVSGIQISVCNASYNKGMTYRLYNVPK